MARSTSTPGRARIEKTTIDDVFVDGTGLTGIVLQGSRNTIRNSRVRNTGEHGIYIGGDHFVEGTGQRVLDSIIESPMADGSPHSVVDAIKVTYTTGAVIANNSLSLAIGRM